jgi:hypothetical protein
MEPAFMLLIVLFTTYHETAPYEDLTKAVAAKAAEDGSAAAPEPSLSTEWATCLETTLETKYVGDMLLCLHRKRTQDGQAEGGTRPVF